MGGATSSHLHYPVDIIGFSYNSVGDEQVLGEEETVPLLCA